MSPNPYTTERLIELVKNLEMIQVNVNTFTDDDLCQLMNHALQNEIVPLIMKTNEEYFVVSEDFGVDRSTVSIAIPRNAIAARLRSVAWVDSNGTFNLINRLQPENVNNSYLSGGSIINGNSGGYLLKQNKIVFYPQVQASGTLQVNYFRRPNILTNVANVGQIVSIDTDANTVTLNTAPDEDTWDTGTVLDAIYDYQPFEFADEQFAILSRNGLDFEFSAEVIANLEVGQFLSSTGYSCFPQYIPIEAQGVLVQATANLCLKGMNDLDGLKQAQMTLKELKDNLLSMITPRVQSETQKIGSSGRGIGGAGGWGTGGVGGI